MLEIEVYKGMLICFNILGPWFSLKSKKIDKPCLLIVNWTFIYLLNSTSSSIKKLATLQNLLSKEVPTQHREV